MLTRTKFFLLLFVLHCPPFLLIPLAQQDLASTSNTKNLVVLGPNQIEQITPNNSNVAEIIQQIDVKDGENRVISNINHVVIGDESNETTPSIIIENNTNNRTLNYETNNLFANNELVPIENVSSVLNHTGVTNSLKDSSPLLLTNSLNGTSVNTLKAYNITVHELLNNPPNETQTNPWNTRTINNANVNNAIVKEVSTVQDGSTSNVNVSSTVVPYISGGTTINFGGENITSLNNILSSGLENEETGVPILETIDGENVLQESINDAEVELAWRSDIPVGKNKTKNLKHNAKLVSQNASLLVNNINGNINNTNSDVLDYENDKEKSIFVILNSGKIDGLSVNSPANSGNLQTNLDNNTIKNLNSSNSKFLNDLINSTVNDVLSKILQQNHSNLNSTHIFLLLNSGSISNVHISSPVLENIVQNTTLKDRSRRHLNASNTNNTDVESVTLKPAINKSNPIIDIKFRTDEHQGTQNNINKDNHAAIIPIDNNQDSSSLVPNAPDNNSLANSNTTVVEIPNEDISSAEAPAFRSLIPDKIRKLQQVPNVVNNELNETKDHNLVLQLSPESPPLSFNLNQIPINDLLGGAFSFIKRLKRNTHDKSENNYPSKTNCKTKQINEHHTVTSCNKSKLNNNDWTIPTRKSLDDNISNVLKLYDSVELVCPLSVIAKLYTHQVLDNISKNDPDSLLNKILSSFVNGNEDAINLVSKKLFDLPIPVKIRLQLVHGKTEEFMEQLSDIVDATLCSLS